MSNEARCANVFVTVGTTDFDELIQSLDSIEFVNALCTLGCRRLVLQIGRGRFEPQQLPTLCAERRIAFEFFRFKPTLDEEMQTADLIICHCGAGSILECISLQKRFVVVVNSSLQDNHQTELSCALATEKYCLTSTPSDILQVIRDQLPSDFYSMKLFPIDSFDTFPATVDSLFHWK